MDLETFLTTVYVLVDDWYKQYIEPYKPKRPGPKLKMSDSEVLTLAVVGQWQAGVPWQSERGLVRYMRTYGRNWFPKMLERSAFNARVRDLWGALIALQQLLAAELRQAEDAFECVDCEPVPCYSNGQAERACAHWLWQSSRGRGGTSGGFFFGYHLLVTVTPSRVITGWILGSAAIQDRWLLEALLSARAGVFALAGPPRDTHQPYADHPLPPAGHIGPWQACGLWSAHPYLADKGFYGTFWQDHWHDLYQANVIAPPASHARRAWPRPWRRWFAHHRQIVDTTFAFLDTVFGMKHLNAHSLWGLYTRVAAKITAYNLGLFINRLLGRPSGCLETLLC